MGKIEKAIQFMEAKAADPSCGYDQIYRWGEKGDYDCSSLVITAWQSAGVPVKTKGATYTGNMYNVFIACGFKDVTKEITLSNGSGLKRGDVLLHHSKHTAMYCGNGKEVEASINEKGTATGGKPGDQTGGEVLVRAYRNYPWQAVLRYAEESTIVKQKSVSELASEVLQGLWGNGDERVAKLKSAGYDADEVQKKVNEIIGLTTTTSTLTTVSSDKHPFVKRAYKYNTLMKKDVASGICWYYSNHKCKTTFYRARKYATYKTNCARFINWILRAEKVLSSGMYFYVEHGRIVWANTETTNAIKKKCDIIEIKGQKTLRQLYNAGEAIPGDIICYSNMQHVNMLGYSGKCYDAGHAYCNEAGEGAKFTTWRGKMVHADQPVSHIIRLRR